MSPLEMMEVIVDGFRPKDDIRTQILDTLAEWLRPQLHNNIQILEDWGTHHIGLRIPGYSNVTIKMIDEIIELRAVEETNIHGTVTLRTANFNVADPAFTFQPILDVLNKWLEATK